MNCVFFDEEGKGKEQEMLTTITNINNTINGVVWGWPALILLGVTGILMTCLTEDHRTHKGSVDLPVPVPLYRIGGYGRHR